MHKPQPDWTATASLQAVQRLMATGTIGLYSRVEVTEVIAIPKDQPATNVLTVAVAEDGADDTPVTAGFLGKRITLPGLKSWTFGVCRYALSIDNALAAVTKLASDGTWAASGKDLRHAAYSARPPQFVPPDGTEEVAWNRVLKNNFRNGSHVFEWADLQKAHLAALFATPQHMKALSDAVQERLPLGLASLADRWGNFVLQLPVTVLMARFSGLQDGSFLVETGWHPDATPRPLRATVELEFDGVVTGYASAAVSGERTRLATLPGPGAFRGTLYDEENGVILASTGPSAFVRSIGLNMRYSRPEPRLFETPDRNGGHVSQRVAIHDNHESVIGDAETDRNAGWTRRRMYQAETALLVRERRFVQYRPNGQPVLERQRAIEDLRALIQVHGKHGAWLWDPYLSAEDILNTLFFSPHGGSDLRGLTAMAERPGDQEESVTDFVQRQRDTLNKSAGNCEGLRLEFRARIGGAGWAFHDRFLIFPGEGSGALAWSLGTSVNNVGKSHHILQRVDDGQRVMDAFLELWDKLAAPAHLIWKVPSR